MSGCVLYPKVDPTFREYDWHGRVRGRGREKLVLKRCLYSKTILKINKSRTVGMGENEMFFDNHADTSA